MEAHIFYEISLVLAVATFVAGIMQVLKQPLIIAYIFTGLLVGPSFFNLVTSTETLELFSHLGIAFLLFIIGLGLNPKVIKEVGKVAVTTGLGQVLFTSSIGFGIAYLLGFELVPALYIAVAVTFSSTIIILKLLSDKKELNRLHGKIATGFLLVQDLVAAIALIFISTLSSTHSSSISLLLFETALKGIIFAGLVSIISMTILPKIYEFFAHSQELLFMFSIGWGLGVAALGSVMGFSIEIGALAAGVSLAASPYTYEISSRMRPLRDFFIIIFFIFLGTKMGMDSILTTLPTSLIFSAFILIGNPLIVMSIMGLLGYTKNTSFKAGLTVAQISEFSLVLILLGNQVGHLSEEVVSMVTLVGLITIAGSTYMILYDDKLFKLFSPVLSIFERSKTKSESKKELTYDAILFGYKGGSEHYIKAFEKLNHKFLVVDYNPEVVDKLESEGVHTRYGDAHDTEFLETLDLSKLKLAVVNVTDTATNAIITDHIRAENENAVIIASMKSNEYEEALDLYHRGADYVMMPRYLTSIKMKNLLVRHGLNKKWILRERGKHKKFLYQN